MKPGPATVLLLLLAFARSVPAEEEGALRRDPAAVVKIAAAEKMIYLPRREGLTWFSGEATVHAKKSREIRSDTYKLRFGEPGETSVRWRDTFRSEKDDWRQVRPGVAKEVLRRELMERLFARPAFYPDADHLHIEPLKRTPSRVTLLDDEGTGVEVEFDRSGLPKRHVLRTKGKKVGTVSFEFFRTAPETWVLRRVKRSPGGFEMEIVWDEYKGVSAPDGIRLPRRLSVDTGSVEFGVLVSRSLLKLRPAGEPMKLPPRSDPGALALLRRADRRLYRPVDEGLQAVSFTVTASAAHWKRDHGFLLKFRAPDVLEYVDLPSFGDPAPAAEAVQARGLTELLFVDDVLRKVGLYPDLTDFIVRFKAGRRDAVLVCREGKTELSIEFDANGAPTKMIRFRGLHKSEQIGAYDFVDGHFLFRKTAIPDQKLAVERSWKQVDGFWLPVLAEFRDGKVHCVLKARDFKVTGKVPPK